ncbi:MAG: polysaccharide deacetylase family protein [Acuticoccus sp.]
MWWRDDDARRPGPRLDRLRAVADGAPLALAVIPEGATGALFDWCGQARADVLQHGIAHRNHQTSGKKAELGDARAADDIVAALVAARRHLAGAMVLKVLVPPWNRMREDLAAPLAAAGYRGVSRFGKSRRTAPLLRVDTHIDPIAWRTTRGLAEPDALDTMADNAITAEGPIGLLTHHIDHDEAVWAFLADFARLVTTHEGARWASAAEIFGADE